MKENEREWEEKYFEESQKRLWAEIIGRDFVWYKTNGKWSYFISSPTYKNYKKG